MHVTFASDIVRTTTRDRIRAAEQHRLAKLAREARKDERARAVVARQEAAVRRPRLAAIFAH
ncbi:hypothetical protein GCM10028801_29380 [Nocardioides maradonensis]